MNDIPVSLSNEFSPLLYPPARAVISIAGMPGVGKSTLTANLLKAGAIEPNQLYTSSLLTTEDAKAIAILDSLQESLGREALEPDFQRVFLAAELRRSQSIISKTASGSLVVLDRGVEDTIYVTELASIRSEGQYIGLKAAYYKKILKIRASLVILLNASLPTLRERIANRAAKSQKASSDREDYFALFYSRHVSWYQQNVPNCIVVETEQLSPIEVAEYAATFIRKMQLSTSGD